MGSGVGRAYYKALFISDKVAYRQSIQEGDFTYQACKNRSIS